MSRYSSARDVSEEGVERAGLLIQDLLHDRDVSLPVNRAPVGEELVKHAAHDEHLAATIQCTFGSTTARNAWETIEHSRRLATTLSEPFLGTVEYSSELETLTLGPRAPFASVRQDWAVSTGDGPSEYGGRSSGSAIPLEGWDRA
jgi:hypothetical protein